MPLCLNGEKLLNSHILGKTFDPRSLSAPGLYIHVFDHSFQKSLKPGGKSNESQGPSRAAEPELFQFKAKISFLIKSKAQKYHILS